MKTHSWPENHWRWPIELSHYHGVRRGGFVFTGGQADLDKKGEVVNPCELTAQTKNVIDHVETILKDLESSLADVIKFVVYFTGGQDDERLILDLLAARIGAQTQPVVSTICLPELCYPGMRIELEAVAIDPEYKSDQNPQFFKSTELHPLPNSFSHAVRCNNIVFTGDISAIDSTDTLIAPDDVIEQTRVMMQQMEHLLLIANVSSKNALKINVFYLGDGTAQSWTEPAVIRASHFPEPGPAATGIAVTRFARAGLMTKMAVCVAAEHVGDVAQSPKVQYSWPDGHWDWTSHLPYKHGNAFGPVIHLGGQVALNSKAEVLHPNEIVEQTKIALTNIKTILTDLGATVDDVVKVTTFYQGGASADDLHKNLMIRSNAFTKPGPATSGIPIPHLVYENMVIEIEVIAIKS